MCAFVYAICVVAWLITLVPCVTYLTGDWRSRRDLLFAVINSDGALRLYYTQFFPSEVSVISDFRTRFSRDFTRRYGRQHYIVPMFLLFVVVGLGMWWIAETILSWLHVDAILSPLPRIAAAAFLGAYAWVLLDQFSRFRRQDFTKHDIYNAVYRFLIAVPLGYSFASVAKEDLGVAIAFFIGTFPTQSITKFGSRFFIQKTGLGEAESDRPNELTKLQGVGRDNAERFQELGITTIVELAWVDPVDITIRTNFDFNYIVDCVSQALLWVYFEDKTKLLYPLGFRGAQETISTLREVDSNPTAKAAVASAAKLLDIDEEAFKNAANQVVADPYARFIDELWSYAPNEGCP
jgi:hypothetical protein